MTHTRSVESNKARNGSLYGIELAPSPASIARLESQTSSMLSQNAGRQRHGLPPWDRTMDVVYHKHVEGIKHVDREYRFTSALDSFFSENGRSRSKTGYFRLPDRVRFRICEYLLSSHYLDKPIRLSRPFFDQDVWQGSDFQSLPTALGPLIPYLEVSFAFRADTLLAFLSGNTFHTTFSPYVGTRISTLATTWFNRYGPYMQNVAVEVDMTRLGFGPAPEAINLLTGTSHIQTLLEGFVASQLRRDESRPLESLVLLCRRFYGRRNDAGSTKQTTQQSGRASSHSRRSQKSENAPSTEGSVRLSRESEEDRSSSPGISLKLSNSAPTTISIHNDSFSSRESPDLKLSDWPSSPFSQCHQLEYCPDSALTICNHLIRLHSRIDSLRMCGFSESYTTRFIATLTRSMNICPELHMYRVTPSTIWPRLGGQKSFVETVEGHLALDDHDAARSVEVPRAFSRWEGCVQFPPPMFDPQGSAIFPPIVDLLQRMRTRSLGLGLSVSYEACPRLGQQLDLVMVPAQSTNNDSRRLGRLLEKYGKPRIRSKRSLTREMATTL